MIRLFQIRGSVFPRALSVALPCGCAAAFLRWLIDEGTVNLPPPHSVLNQTAAWTSFSGLVGFLVVFRTSQSYTRFWSGCTSTHQMRAEWFDACSQIVSFCKVSKASTEVISNFQGKLVRLFSMLHAAALAELEEINHDVNFLEDIQAFNYKLIDPAGFDEATLRALKNSASKVELLFNWIQLLLIESMDVGILVIAPPILSRSFQGLSNGMVAFFDALKLTYSPFPFPYAQTCDLLLVIHWIVAPFVITQWVSHFSWAMLFVTIQVFILWSLNFIACEIENPFGSDANDLDGFGMQEEMNSHLLLLLSNASQRLPQLSPSALTSAQMQLTDMACTDSLIDVWCDLMDSAETVPDPIRKGHAYSRASVSQLKVYPAPSAARLSRSDSRSIPGSPTVRLRRMSAFPKINGSTLSPRSPRSPRAHQASADGSSPPPGMQPSIPEDRGGSRHSLASLKLDLGGRSPREASEPTQSRPPRNWHPAREARQEPRGDSSEEPQGDGQGLLRDEDRPSEGSSLQPTRNRCLSGEHRLSGLKMTGGGPVDGLTLPSSWRQDRDADSPVPSVPRVPSAPPNGSVPQARRPLAAEGGPPATDVF
mmetsp:Transcript_16999/g.53419  ORF Transcript_16999/g.53419 Transcript_16999/m.53419 type:complete len:594 (-) Transcript_16999:36-1817(-)